MHEPTHSMATGPQRRVILLGASILWLGLGALGVSNAEAQQAGATAAAAASAAAGNTAAPSQAEGQTEGTRVASGAEAASSSPSSADRQQFFIERVPPESVLSTPGSPASTASIPGGWGASNRQVFVGAGYQARTRYTRSDDGALVAGVGLFDPARFVGLEVAFTATSTVRSGFGDRSTMSFKAHRLLSESMAVSVGYENALEFGTIGDGGQTLYVALGKVFVRHAATRPFSQVTVNVGVGDGRFRTEDQILEDKSTLGVFGGVSVRLLPRVSTMVEWTGQDLAIGASFVPFTNFPIVVTPALVDVAGQAGDGTRLSIGLGFGTQF